MDSSEALPQWVEDDFDTHTGLPHGPLEHLPIPIEGQLFEGRATLPCDDKPRVWSARAHCNEDLAETVRFYDEFLPLCGYDILATGTEYRRIAWLGRAMTTRRKIMVIRRGLCVGRIAISVERTGQTLVDACLGDRTHPDVCDFASSDALKCNDTIAWD